MAALLNGQSINQAAKEYNIPASTVYRWSTEGGAGIIDNLSNTKKERIGELLVDYLTANIQALRAQAELFSDKEWLRKQSAENAAVLHGVMTDKAVRLIEALGSRTIEQETTNSEP